MTEINFDAKATAVVSSLLETYKGQDSVDLINFVLSELDLTDDGIAILMSMSELTVTAIVLMADILNLDPIELWTEFVLNSQ